jgi:hypothetical protein
LGLPICIFRFVLGTISGWARESWHDKTRGDAGETFRSIKFCDGGGYAIASMTEFLCEWGDKAGLEPDIRCVRRTRNDLVISTLRLSFRHSACHFDVRRNLRVCHFDSTLRLSFRRSACHFDAPLVISTLRLSFRRSACHFDVPLVISTFRLSFRRSACHFDAPLVISTFRLSFRREEKSEGVSFRLNLVQQQGGKKRINIKLSIT